MQMFARAHIGCIPYAYIIHLAKGKIIYVVVLLSLADKALAIGPASRAHCRYWPKVGGLLCLCSKGGRKSGDKKASQGARLSLSSRLPRQNISPPLSHYLSTALVWCPPGSPVIRYIIAAPLDPDTSPLYSPCSSGLLVKCGPGNHSFPTWQPEPWQ